MGFVVGYRNDVVHLDPYPIHIACRITLSASNPYYGSKSDYLAFKYRFEIYISQRVPSFLPSMKYVKNW